MQAVNPFLLQEIIFTKLQNNLLNIKIFKIINKHYYEKFILIESIKEDNSNIAEQKFTIALNVFTNSFDHKDLFNIFNFIENSITKKDFEHIKNFVNVKLVSKLINSNMNNGFIGKIEFICFFEPVFDY
jgi:hypothetical protein